MIGNRPNTAPSSAESSACPSGIVYTASAMTIATPSEQSAAQCAGNFTPPSSTKSVIRGNTAKIAVRPSESPTGS